MKHLWLSICLFCAAWSISAQEEIFTNKVFRSEVMTPQCYPDGQPLGFPYYELYSTQLLDFHFDWMDTDRPMLSFGIFHCDRSWHKTDMISSVYMKGFPWTTIDDVNSSFNTQIQYNHYHFQFPNEQMQPKVSGNYAVVVFEGNDPEDVNSYVVSFRIVVYESAVGVRAACSPSSNVADRRNKQQVDFDIVPGTFRANSPMRDISAAVIQNFSWSRSIHGLKPIFITPNAWTFDYNSEVDFDAGNEWRTFEFKNFNFRSRFVANIQQEADGFHVYLNHDLPRGAEAYSFYQDLDGLTFVKNDLAEDFQLESDYAYVHFFMRMPELFEGKLKLEYAGSEFYDGSAECTWDEKNGGYACKVLMKQGVMSYRFVIEDKYHTLPDLSLTEGNFSETGNVYTVVVYFSDFNLGLDRVLQVYTVNSTQR